MLYKYKKLKYNFVIIAYDYKIDCIKSTINSVKILYPEANYLVVAKEKHPDIAKVAPIFVGDTISSMINIGMQNSDDWNFIIMSKGSISNRIDIKYSYFVESENDILFSVVRRDLNFVDASIHGMLLHRKSFTNIGNFLDIPFENSKIIWGTCAIEKGYKFKGVVGSNLN